MQEEKYFLCRRKENFKCQSVLKAEFCHLKILSWKVLRCGKSSFYEKKRGQNDNTYSAWRCWPLLKWDVVQFYGPACDHSPTTVQWKGNNRIGLSSYLAQIAVKMTWCIFLQYNKVSIFEISWLFLFTSNVLANCHSKQTLSFRHSIEK